MDPDPIKINSDPQTLGFFLQALSTKVIAENSKKIFFFIAGNHRSDAFDPGGLVGRGKI